MLKAVKKTAKKINSKLKILGVTVLTSLSNNNLKEIGYTKSVKKLVTRQAILARLSGLDGIVCSGQEAKTVRKILGPNLLIFTPGIRMNKDNKDDQQRVCTQMESIKNGTDKIIMGRSLIKGNIEENLNQVAESIKT